MNTLPALLFCFIAGAGLGAVFFGGLWLTVKHLPTRRYPMAWILASWLGRSAVVVAGFYWLMDGSWQRLLAALAGLVSVRIVLARRRMLVKLSELTGGNR